MSVEDKAPVAPGPAAEAVAVVAATLTTETPLRNVSQSMAAQIEAWFDRHFRGTRLGFDTELWNIAQAAKEDLKAIFATVK